MLTTNGLLNTTIIKCTSFQERKALNAVGRCGPSGHRAIGCVTAVHRGGSAPAWGLIPVGSARTAWDTRGKHGNATLIHAKVIVVAF